MDKISGQELKNSKLSTETKLNNIYKKIQKKFDLIIDDFRKYITDEDKKYIENNSIHSLSIDDKLKIIINTENNYINLTSNQLEIFKDDKL